MARPDISVVIPTRNREMRLGFALEALAGQKLAPERFEVIVVRASDVAPPFANAPAGLDVRFLSCPPGPAAQRNVGWRAARGELIAFTDDDCRPSPGWLEGLLAAWSGNGAILQGRTEPDVDEAHLLHVHARSIEIMEASEWFQTCNIAYPRELLDSLGGFDEAFPTAWGEDTDLGFRALEAGADHRFVERALTYHAVNARSVIGAAKEALRRDSLPMVIARHPAARRLLYLGVFVRRTHAFLLLALAGLLLARRAPLLAALALLPYARSTRANLRPVHRAVPGLLCHLPAQAVVDGASVLAVGRAGIRERVLVL